MQIIIIIICLISNKKIDLATKRMKKNEKEFYYSKI